MKKILKSGKWDFEIDGEVLLVRCNKNIAGEFTLAPLVNGSASRLGEWEKVSNSHFKSKAKGCGSVNLAIEYGRICYWIETDKKEFATLTYFPKTKVTGEAWQTYMSDEHDRLWDVNLDTEVLISSAYADISNPDGADGAGMTDPGDFPDTWIWNIPVRALSFKTGVGWLGLSIPGPLPVGVTRLKMEDRKFSITFQVLRPSCREGSMPRVYFVTNLADAYAVLDEHRDISSSMGLMVKKNSNHPVWWTNPWYNYWDEYCRKLYWDSDTKRKREEDTQRVMEVGIKTEDLLEWLEYTRKSTRVPEINTTLEQYCYNCYGDYTPVKGLGGTEGLRKTIDEMREKGVRFGYYIHPYMFNTKIEFFKKHPEAFCKPKDKTLKLKYTLERNEDEPEYALIDWTHPKGREYILKQIEFILSDKQGCLNADILRSNNWRSPDPRVYDFYDPDWGIGDLMTMKVQKLIYEKAKQVKPHCAVSKISFADCYMQPWADIDGLCEEWNGQTTNWYRRAQIVTRTISDVIFWTDAWFVTLTKGYEYYMCMLAWGVPETCAYKHAIHPYIYYRELKEKDYRRRRAGFQVYLNAPINITDECRVNWNNGEVEIWRKRTQGPLKGWYAALAISKRCFVTYSEKQALIASSDTRWAKIPLPPGAKLLKITKVCHDGKEKECPAKQIRAGNEDYLEMRIEDCGQKVMYFRVKYANRA